MNKAITGTAYGMFINAGSVSFGDNAKIISQAQIDNNMKNTNENGIKVRGIYIDTSNNNIWSEDVIKNTNAIVEFGDGATIQAINNSKGGETTGVYAHDSVVFKGASQIVAEAGSEGKHDSYGVYATSEKGDVDLGTASVISVINNSNASTAYTAGIKAVDSSKVTMRGGSISGKSADGENFKAIVTSDAAQVNVNADGAQNIIVEGDLEADSQSQIKMRANDAQSYLIGAVTTAYEENVDDDSKTKTDLTFKNTTWYLTGDSNVTNLTLDNGIVSMVENANLARTVSGNAQKLSIDKALNGSGTFIMDLKYYDNDVKSYENATDSDFIYIHGGDNSEQRLVFKDNNSNLGAMASDAKLYFAQIKNNAATFGDGGDSVTDGGEKYDTVTAINEKGIYDLEFYIDSEQNAEQADYNDWFITGKTNKSNPNGDGPIHSYNAGFALWRDDDTLLKRLGELRFTNDEGGAWARVIGKKLEDNRSLGFNTHAKTVQVGYDRKDVQEDGSGTWRKGVALGHTWADTGFRGGRGENNYTDLTLYATNIRKHDHYWDLVARIGYIDSEYDTAYGDRGEFDNWAGSLSAEYGRKKKLNEDNWFIEPQAQLTYSYMWGDSYTTRNGARVVQSDADSLVGRAGFIISKEIESERKYPHRYYAKAFIMHEFLDGGDNNIYFDSDRLYGGSDFKDTWYVAGVGANVDMGNSCTFYFDAERNFKAHAKMPYRIEAGFRWEF
ncbi:MAG: autotransporter outer membrane beta-barrel domain-containing protein [Phascolarctobacterium sp.]|uniref:autotransporter outer membrane beta-barrel domain-containing protein n=1 Tax=Phascolarctobacterium sp. TaxID=2049039 RepID=UPI0026DB0D21|nr:autotransporter outer membrane beta-barrel domain-containing protein [Phascolarctobacterium sp.]MDO4921494.1 autotransporter outer membrane beta-barrel domain-containing protein [Phascolarctobacterium sp.]